MMGAVMASCHRPDGGMGGGVLDATGAGGYRFTFPYNPEGAGAGATGAGAKKRWVMGPKGNHYRTGGEGAGTLNTKGNRLLRVNKGKVAISTAVLGYVDLKIGGTEKHSPRNAAQLHIFTLNAP